LEIIFVGQLIEKQTSIVSPVRLAIIV